MSPANVENSAENHVDVLVVGAGLSGIAAAYYLQKECPQKTFAVLEARNSIGGTWDLFRYPGIRSDSDMHTLGFSFFPWRENVALASGPSILSYLDDTVKEFGLGAYLRLGRRVEHASWSSDDSRWTVAATVDGRTETWTCSFLWGCTGYYDYGEGYTPEFEGTEAFQGQIIHPQHWPEELDYRGKRVVVIGSGATAITLVPAMARDAEHVVMLQRSPTYVLSVPGHDAIAETLQRALGENLGSFFTRWKNILRIMFFYQLSRRRPERVKRWIMSEIRRELGPDYDIGTHFNPPYDPWDQRVCVVPDADLFEAIKDGSVSVVTDHIERFTKTGLALRSGVSLDADIIVTATGLKISLLGGTTIDVDGKSVTPGEHALYKGTMLNDVPNAAISIGYTNASWTLKCELISEYVVRLLNYMDEHGYSQCWPRKRSDVTEVPLIDFSSGYIQRAQAVLPHQGSRSPWRLYQNYIFDQWLLRRGRVDDPELEFVSS